MKGLRFYQTDLNLSLCLLENLARYEILTSRDLSFLVYGDDTHSHIVIINKALERLRTHDHLVNRVHFTPEDYKGRGNIPNAWGLNRKGVHLAKDRWPSTYPVYLSPKHSPHTIEHDLRPARAHIRMDKLCAAHSLTIGWLKETYNIVKPDGTFEITKNKTTHFFLEYERHVKDYADLINKKLRPYVNFYANGKMKEAWGFSYYTVIIPMRSEESKKNLLSHLKGVCNCIDPNHRRLHAKHSYALSEDYLWITTHDDIQKNTAGKIFHTPKGNTHSFLDIIR